MTEKTSAEKRTRKTVVLGGPSVLLIVLGFLYYEVYLVPMRRARPILNMLQPTSSSNDRGQAFWSILGGRRIPESGEFIKDENFKPLQGIASKRVKQQILKNLSLFVEGKVDRDFGRLMLLLVFQATIPEDHPSYILTGLRFDKDSDWEIIGKAAEAYNEQDVDPGNGGLSFNCTDKDGTRRLGMGMRMGIE